MRVGARVNPEDDATPGGGKRGSFLPHAARKGGDACPRGAGPDAGRYAPQFVRTLRLLVVCGGDVHDFFPRVKQVTLP
jgi:hypothetical protein